jgi:CBS domain-containing protein
LSAEDASRPAITITLANSSLQDLRDILLKYGISRIVVVDEGDMRKPVGIITEKDISRFLYSGATNKPMNKIGLQEILPENRKIITVNKCTSLEESAKMMMHHQISSLVVTDNEGRTTGILTKTDLLDFYTKHFAGRATVGEYMTRKVQAVRPDDPVYFALSLMRNLGISRVIVVSHGKPVGIITGRDLLQIIPLLHVDSEKLQEKEEGKEKEKLYHPSGTIATILSENVMKPMPITITDYSDVADAAMIMKGNRISGLPVIDSDNNLVGVITSTDVIRAIADFEKR